MKKIIALSLVLMTLVCCFAACSKKIKGAEVISNYDDGELLVSTDDKGNIARNEFGDIIQIETEEDGKAVTDDNGEKVTRSADLKHALDLGDRIEFNDYYVVIPKGWVNDGSYNDLDLRKEGTDDTIKIMKTEDDISKVTVNVKDMLDKTKSAFSDATVSQTEIKAGDKSAPLYYSYIPKSADGTPTFFGYLLIENGSDVYRAMILSDRDLSKDTKDLETILNSIQFK